MPTGVITANISQSLKETLLFAFRTSLEGPTVWSKCGFKEMTSKDAFEDMTEYAGLGLAPVKAQLAQMSVDVVQQGYTTRFNQVAYAIMMPVSEEALRMKKYNEAIDGAASIAESMKQTQEFIGSDIFGNAFDGTNFAVADSKAMCATDHPLIKGGTYSNTLATAMSLSETALETVFTQCRKMPGSNGLPVGVRPMKLVLPAELEWEAKRILKSDLQNDTANNAINSMKGEGLEYVINRYLPSTSNWFTVTNAKRGLMCIWNMKPDFREYNTEANRAKVYDGYQMFAMGIVDPRAVIGSNI